MRKSAVKLALVLMLLIPALDALRFVDFARADETIYPWDMVFKALPIISVDSPLNNTRIFADTSLLSFTVTKPKDWLVHGGYNSRQMLIAVGYELDGKPYGPFLVDSYLSSPFNFRTNLTLDQGFHTLQVYGNASGWVTGNTHEYEVPITAWSGAIYFVTFPSVPTITAQLAEINGTSLLLNFTVNEPTSKITYSLDNQENVTVAGNTTLTGLPNGFHNVTVYATNEIGSTGTSETLFFNVKAPESFPVAPVAIASIATIAAVGAALLVYFRRRKC